MKALTLKQMRYFEALARHGHFGHAADSCAISQPALSMQIREMEEILGSPLFERGGRRVRLTGFGQAAANHVGAILREVEALADMARAAQDRLVGPLRLGVIPTIAPYLLPRLIGRLMREHQGLDIHVRESLTGTLLQELSDGRLDAAIVALPVSEPALQEVALFSERFMLVRPLGDAEKPAPDREALRAMRLLLLEEGHCFRDQALAFCNLGAARPRELLDGSSLSTLVQMVGAGIGVTLIPEMAVPVETRSASVSVVPLEGAQPTRSVGMVWRRASPLARQLMQLADLVRASAEEPPAPQQGISRSARPHAGAQAPARKQGIREKSRR